MTAERIDNADPTFQRRMVNTTPFPRLGKPEDIASGAFFLASDEASFISGHVLVIDGGWLAANSPQG
jgi:3-oxoacyl-[acyl-carrier protein] reductase